MTKYHNSPKPIYAMRMLRSEPILYRFPDIAAAAEILQTDRAHITHCLTKKQYSLTGLDPLLNKPLWFTFCAEEDVETWERFPSYDKTSLPASQIVLDA